MPTLFIMNEPSIASYSALFGMLFEHSPDNVVITDHLARAIYFNPAVLKTIGLTLESLLNKTVIDVMPNDLSAQHHFDAINEVIKTGNSQFLMVHNKHTQFTRPLYDFITITPIFDGDKRVIGTLELIREGQQEKDLEAREIIQREHYLSTLLDTIPFMVWMKDKKSRFMVVNASVAKLLGSGDTKQFEGKTALDFMPAHIATGFMDDDLNVMQSGQSMAMSQLIVSSSGNSFWAETYKTPVHINDEVVGTVGLSRDISVIKQLQSEAANRQSEYALLMQSLPLAIIRYDLECRRTFINAYCERLNSAAAGTAIGKKPTELWMPHIHNITAEAFEMRLRQVMANGITQTFELYGTVQNMATVYALKMVAEYDAQHVVSGVLTIASDITEISQYRLQLEHLAYHDPLTNLPNRMLFNDRLRCAVAQAERSRQQFAVLIVDLDNFKSVNDSMGHATGDLLLVEAAQRLLNSVRKSDTVARMGGDEFAVLVTDVEVIQDISDTAAKIVQLMAAPFNIAQTDYFITASIGIARYPSDSKEIGDLMKYADTAMYHAKHKGRHNYQFYAHELSSNATARLRIETGLRYALERNELEVHYQPCVSLDGNGIVGAEALLRWNSRELGPVGPERFIPVAEESGLIVAIGSWVLMKVLSTAAKLNAKREQPLTISVNMSSRQFVQNDIYASIAQTLQLSGCKPEWITLEITESMLLQDDSHIQATLTALHALGVGISIDDFGTGYSALNYLHKFPISQVKIDRSFVRDIASDHDAAVLVKAIIAMASSLNKQLIVEGIETVEQSQLLSEWGCLLAQGYLFGKALPLKEFESLLPV